jgi:transmembrane sensor
MTRPMPSPEEALKLRPQALAWLVRRQDASWHEGLECEFQQWQSADPRHALIYAQCEARWQQFDGMPDELVQQMRDKLARDQALFARLTPPAAVSRRRILQPVLAGVALATIAGAGVFAWHHQQGQAEWAQAFSTEPGQQKEVRLPDGSRLRLGTATRVEARYYSQRRDVTLFDGEALFDVRAEAARPFQVLAGPLRVTVVGTRFAVRYTPTLAGNDGVQVGVEHGTVLVARATDKADAPVVLIAGQQVAADAAGVLAPVVATAPQGIAPWREHRVSFVDTPLAQALAELARYGPTGLVVRQPEVAALRLTGTFDPGDRAALRRALIRVLPVRLQEQGTEAELMLAR